MSTTRKSKAKLPSETAAALKTLGLQFPSFKGCTQAAVDTRMTQWRLKTGPLGKAIRAHRKKWHPDRRKTPKGKRNAELRFKRGETAAEHLMGLRVKVRARVRESRHQAQHAAPPGQTHTSRSQRHSSPAARTEVAQATGIPPNVPTTKDGVPLGVPRNGIPWHAQQQQLPPQAQLRGVFVYASMDGVTGVGVSSDLDAVLSRIFNSLLQPQPGPATPQRRGGFRLPSWI